MAKTYARYLVLERTIINVISYYYYCYLSNYEDPTNSIRDIWYLVKLVLPQIENLTYVLLSIMSSFSAFVHLILSCSWSLARSTSSASSSGYLQETRPTWLHQDSGCLNVPGTLWSLQRRRQLPSAQARDCVSANQQTVQRKTISI